MATILNRKELYDRLSKNIVRINFNKTNGLVRDMVCTLDPSRFPHHFDVDKFVQEEEMKKPSESGRMNVWDIEAEGWRSFRIENVNWVMTPNV